MGARIKNPAAVVPNAMPALGYLAKIAESSTIPAKTLALVHLRTTATTPSPTRSGPRPRALR